MLYHFLFCITFLFSLVVSLCWIWECMFVCGPVHRSGEPGCLLQSLSTLVSETGSLPEAVSHHLHRLTGWWAPWISLSLIPLPHLQGFRVHYHTQVLYMALGEPNSSFYAVGWALYKLGQLSISLFFVFYCFKDV